MAKAYATGPGWMGAALRPDAVDPEVLRAAQVAARAGVAGDPGVGYAGGTAGKGLMAELKALLKGQPLGKAAKATLKTGAGGVLVYMLLEGLMRTLLQGSQTLAQYGVQKGELEAQAEAAGPEAMRESALQPITQAQRDHALMMLMQQMGGGRNGRAPMLARGEVLT